MGKIGRIIYYSVVVLLIIIFVGVLLGDEYVGSGMGLGISIVLSVVAVLSILASSVMYLVDNPKSAISILIGIGVFLVVGVISYLVAPGTITEHHLDYGVESVGKSKLVDTGIYVTIFLSIVAVVSILVSETVSLIKKLKSMATRKRDIPEINAGSMADIAFLLLVFFLVTTTMDIPNGLQVALPPISEEPPEDSKQKKREVLEVLVNASDQLLVEGAPMTIDKLMQKTVDHLTNEGVNPTLSTTSTKAIVSLKNDRGTSYDMYVQVYNELTAAYNKVRDDYSMQEYGKIYTKLDPARDKEKIKIVKKKFPKKLSEAEPVSIGGDK